VAPNFKPVATRRTFEEAVEQIAEAITLGELRPGDQLPSERLLAQLMQISRPTVREAIKVLADSGVVEVRTGARGGAFVTSEFVPREVLRRRSDLRFAEIGGVLEARRLLEPQVAQLAARRARAADYELLAGTIERQRRLAADAGGGLLEHEDRFLALDAQFHLGIASATQNTTIVSLVRSLLRRLEIARDMAVHQPPVFGWAIEIHERTLDAIRSGNKEEIGNVMDEHLAQLEEVWEREGGRPIARPPLVK
jgi:GntR family transcriptional regulator, transcriptional repressor for pyruvate dehydrogenase complex